MRVLDSLRHMVQAMPDDALVVASHTDNSTACCTANITERCLIGFNMGFATPVGLGLALALPHRRVFILDGDGGVLLLAAALADLGSQQPPNTVVVVADNESSLGFPSHTAKTADLPAMARAAGIQHTCTVRNLEEFEAEFAQALSRQALSYIVAKTEPGLSTVPTGTQSPFLWENKFAFVRYIEQTEGVAIMRPFGGP
jgi:thiamine pyrophosphate-dependent acetolactate synthase large subunit-like protein